MRIITLLAALTACLTATTAANAQRDYGRHWGDDNRGDYNRGDHNRNAANDFRAAGVIDDTVDVIIRGNRVSYNTRSGDRPRDIDLRLNRPLPRRNVNVSVDKRDGRGEVRVIQQPRRDNDYTAVIRVRDSQGGSDRYAVTANW